MPATGGDEVIRTLNIVKELEIAASIEATFKSVLAELGPEGEMPDGKPFPMTFEAWPGGRWFRDLGNNAGHFWGHVQVIKPPTILEISGPIFMSYPGANFIQYKLTAEGKSARLKFTHRAMGLITDDHREGVGKGWSYRLEKVRKLAERR